MYLSLRYPKIAINPVMTLHDDPGVNVLRHGLVIDFCIPNRPMCLVDFFIHLVYFIFRPKFAIVYELESWSQEWQKIGQMKSFGRSFPNF